MLVTSWACCSCTECPPCLPPSDWPSPLTSCPSSSLWRRWLWQVWGPSVDILSLLSPAGSVYCVVVVAIERYFSVCRPFEQKVFIYFNLFFKLTNFLQSVLSRMAVYNPRSGFLFCIQYSKVSGVWDCLWNCWSWHQLKQVRSSFCFLFFGWILSRWEIKIILCNIFTPVLVFDISTDK